jgi:GNAT superfamily N-acetyltransferase
VQDGDVIETERLAARARDAVRQLLRVADVLRALHRDELDIIPARPADAAELLVLQRCCWVDEAIANSRLDLPALLESEEQVVAGMASWTTWCVRHRGRLVGSVRARREGDTWEIGRLMVAPDHRGNGLGRRLLHFAESKAPAGVTLARLFTGERSDTNIVRYQKAGYHLSPTPAPTGAVPLTKPLPASRP